MKIKKVRNLSFFLQIYNTHFFIFILINLYQKKYYKKEQEA